jgi:hypothetical protein
MPVNSFSASACSCHSALANVNSKRCRILHNPGEILVPRRSVDDNAKPVLVHEVDDQVINDATVFIEHAGIERFAGFLQLGDVVRQQMAQEWARAITTQVDDRHMRDIKHAGIATHGVMFFFLRAVVQWHIPATEVDDASCGCDVLVIQRRFRTHLSFL